MNIAESPDRPAVIHGVQHVFHAPAWLPRWPSDDRRSRMIFITRHVPQRWVELLLDAIDAGLARRLEVDRAGHDQAVDRARHRDVVETQALLVVLSICVIAATLSMDVLNLVLDPRLRTS